MFVEWSNIVKISSPSTPLSQSLLIPNYKLNIEVEVHEESPELSPEGTVDTISYLC